MSMNGLILLDDLIMFIVNTQPKFQSHKNYHIRFLCNIPYHLLQNITIALDKKYGHNFSTYVNI